MDVTAVAVVAATVFVWGVVSARLERADLTAPMVFVAVGAVLAGLGLIDAPSTPENLKPLVEVTLVWVLFSDAARIRVSDLRHDLGPYVRLLGFGLPLTIVLGWVLAIWLLPGLDVWLALLVAGGAGAHRCGVGGAGGDEQGGAGPDPAADDRGERSQRRHRDSCRRHRDRRNGVCGGSARRGQRGGLLRWARHWGWSGEEFTGVAVLALALASYAGALVVHGNGFVAAFCGGLAFGAAAGPRGPSEVGFLEQASGLVSLLVWLPFGAIAIPIVLNGVDLGIVLYAVLSLTLVRMLPVALVAVGAGFDRATDNAAVEVHPAGVDVGELQGAQLPVAQAVKGDQGDQRGPRGARRGERVAQGDRGQGASGAGGDGCYRTGLLLAHSRTTCDDGAPRIRGPHPRFAAFTGLRAR